MKTSREEEKNEKLYLIDLVQFPLKHVGTILRIRDSDITQTIVCMYGWLCDPSLWFSCLSFSSLQKPLHKFEVNKLLPGSAWPIDRSLRTYFLLQVCFSYLLL